MRDKISAGSYGESAGVEVEVSTGLGAGLNAGPGSVLRAGSLEAASDGAGAGEVEVAVSAGRGSAGVEVAARVGASESIGSLAEGSVEVAVQMQG